MDVIKGDILVHPRRVVYVQGRPTTVDGTVDQAVYFNGVRQYVDAGQNVTCHGNLENCPNGFTLRFRINPLQLRDNTYFLSSAPFDVYYKDNMLQTEFRTPKKKWKLTAPGLDRNAWHLVEVSWDPQNGMSLYVDSKKVGQELQGEKNYDVYDYDKHLYFGRANTDMKKEKYTQGTIDDIQLWEAKREYLISIGVIPPGQFTSHFSTFINLGPNVCSY